MCDFICQHPSCWAYQNFPGRNKNLSEDNIKDGEDAVHYQSELPKQSICNLINDYGGTAIPNALKENTLNKKECHHQTTLLTSLAHTETKRVTSKEKRLVPFNTTTSNTGSQLQISMVQDVTFKQYFWLPKSTVRLPEKIDQSKKSMSVKDLNNSIILSKANSKIVPLYQKKISQDKPVKLINKPNTSESSRYLETKSKYQTEEAKCDHKKVNTLQLAFENISNQPREKGYSFKSESTQVGLPKPDTTEIEHRDTDSREYKKDMYHEPNIDAERRNSLTRMEDCQKPEIQSSCKLPAISLGLPELPSGLKTTKPFVYKNTHFDFSLGPVFSPPSTVRSVITDVINTTDKQPIKNESPFTSIKLTVDIPVALSTYEKRAEELQITRHLQEAKENLQLTTNLEKQENDVCSEKSRSMESFNSLDQWPIINEYEYDSSTSQIKLGQNLRYSSKGIKLRQNEDFGTDVNQNTDLKSKDEKMKVESPAPPPPSPESKVQREISAGD